MSDSRNFDPRPESSGSGKAGVTPDARWAQPRDLEVGARIVAIASAYGLLAGMALHLWPSLLVLAPVFCCAFILSGFLNAAHDCVHRRHFSTRSANRLAGVIWCTPLLINFTLY